MELFTEIEFDVKEFDKILKVISRLTQEGWELYHTIEYTDVIQKIIVAKRFKLKRYIN